MNKNQITADRLDKMALSDRARACVDATEFNSLYTLFGDCDTPAKVEQIASEIIMEDDDDDD